MSWQEGSMETLRGGRNIYKYMCADLITNNHIHQYVLVKAPNRFMPLEGKFTLCDYTQFTHDRTKCLQNLSVFRQKYNRGLYKILIQD